MRISKLTLSLFETPLGAMIALADDSYLYLLEFADHPHVENKIERLKKKAESMSEGNTPILDSIKKELDAYFKNRLQNFRTPFFLYGTPFQKSVWTQLQKIPSGETWSYGKLAQAINRPLSSRAVGRANSTNQLAIIVPCHRVINATGKLGGYSGGVHRKSWLITHEK